MKLKGTLFNLFFFFSIIAYGQDPVYTQYYNAPNQLNPAFTGNTYGAKFALNYRNQWPLIPFAYNTYSISYDQYFKRFRSGLGAFVLSDNAGNGIYTTNKISLQYAYRIRVVGDTYLKIGIEGAGVQARLDWSKLIFFDQLDNQYGHISPGGTPYPTTETPPDKTSVFYVDVSTGFLLYGPKAYAGFSLKHINTPEQNVINANNNIFTGLPIRYSFLAGTEFNLRDYNISTFNSFFSPSILFVSQRDFMQLSVGGYLSLGVIYGGAWFRHTFGNPDALMLGFGIRKDNFKIGYSFDYTVSSFGIDSGGAHELGIVFVLKAPNRESKYNDCFEIFR